MRAGDAGGGDVVHQELTLCLMHNPPRHQGIEIEPLIVEAM
jgi:hypothetical protein